MQRSSETIGAIAGALAKAQIEIVNPERSLSAIIRSPFPREGDRSFRYASLSNGLDLVRKCLGQHEIATVQSTSIDDAAGLIRLTTTLAHSSGEWVSSDWPVCPVSETAAPHRMGAALTYARRYALFTLVGIAGEDDLDAPDLPLSGGTPPSPTPEQANGQTLDLAPVASDERRRKPGRTPSTPILGPDASVALREQLLSDLAGLTIIEDLDCWAQTCLPAKNTLTTTDARRVDEAFQAKLAVIQLNDEAEAPPASPASSQPDGGIHPATAETAPEAVDKSVLAFPEPRRQRNKIHLRFVAKQPCLICARQPCDAHHLRFAQARGIGLKVSDEFTVPLCRGHHRELHRAGNEANWWSTKGVDAVDASRKLWTETHPVRTRITGAETAIPGPALVAKTMSPRGQQSSVGTPNDETKPIQIPLPQP